MSQTATVEEPVPQTTTTEDSMSQTATVEEPVPQTTTAEDFMPHTLAVLAATPVPEVPAPAPTIATMEELMASHAVIVAQEATDRTLLSPLTSPTSAVYRPQLFAWAAAGFPAIYVIQSFSLTPPSVCSDGVTRDAVNYAWYLLGTEIGGIIANIQSLMPGIAVSYSFEGNVLRIHVSRA